MKTSHIPKDMIKTGRPIEANCVPIPRFALFKAVPPTQVRKLVATRNPKILFGLKNMLAITNKITS